MPDAVMKRCTRCGITKSSAEFHNNKNRKDGKCDWCAECNKAHTNAYYKRKKAEKPKPFIIPGMQQCTKCKEWRSEDSFSPRPLKDGTLVRYSWCKSCCAKYSRETRAKNRDFRPTYPPKMEGTKRCSACKEEKNVLEFSKQRYNKDGRAYTCLECNRKNNLSYSTRHRDEIAVKSKKWLVENKEYASDKKKQRYYGDIQYRLSIVVHNRIRSLLRKSARPKTTVPDIGCSSSFLKSYLESKFYSHHKTGVEMNWGNWGAGYGKWNVDHILPLAAFDLTNEEQLSVVCHYTNLQPLWFEENMSKGAKVPSGFKSKVKPKSRAKPRSKTKKIAFQHKPLIPNVETVAAIKEVMSDSCKSCGTIEELMADLNSDD